MDHGKKWIPGYEGLYYATTDGQIFSAKIGRFMKPHFMPNGYLNVLLYKDKKKSAHGIHRLVAMTFISNPGCLPQVNHIDGDKKNNRVENLEWCTSSGNIQHAYDNGMKENCRNHCRILGEKGSEEHRRYIDSVKKPVTSLRISDGKTAFHESINQAARDTSCDLSAVYKVLHGKQMQTKGYIFEYAKQRSEK